MVERQARARQESNWITVVRAADEMLYLKLTYIVSGKGVLIALCLLGGSALCCAGE
jgi:hypothetical protein